MMNPLDVLLSDRLRKRARVHTRAKLGSGLSRPGSGWIHYGRWQARRFRPYVTVVFIGTNDAFDMRTPDGALVTCCRGDWVGEYARRAGALMRAYSRHGRSRVVWLTLPAPRSAVRWPVARAINYADRFAARRIRGVTVVPVDDVFTPGFRYRATMRYRGRRVRVRGSDGIHLSLDGARILERIVERELRLPPR
jgi:hypothetical protein